MTTSNDSCGPSVDDTPAAEHSTRWTTFTLLGALCLIADQWSKASARTALSSLATGSRELLRWGRARLALTLVHNPGAAWGLFASVDERYRGPFFLVTAVLAMGFVLALYRKAAAQQQTLLIYALPLLFGGAAGNLLDRVRFASVVDFIDFAFGAFRWPTFNVADVAISVGVALIFADMLQATYRDWRARRS